MIQIRLVSNLVPLDSPYDKNENILLNLVLNINIPVLYTLYIDTYVYIPIILIFLSTFQDIIF
jgi:hypothetical protein